MISNRLNPFGELVKRELHLAVVNFIKISKKSLLQVAELNGHGHSVYQLQKPENVLVTSVFIQ